MSCLPRWYSLGQSRGSDDDTRLCSGLRLRHVSRSRKASRASTKPVVGGKRKSTGGSPGRSSKARVSAVLSDEQLAHNMKHRLCHKCGKPGHIARDCESPSQDKSSKGKNGKAKQKKSGEDF